MPLPSTTRSGAQRAHRHRAAEHAAHVVVDEPVVEQVAQHRGDAGDRERRCSSARLPPRVAGSRRATSGWLARAARRVGAGGARATAVTSMRPMLTCTSGVSSAARARGAASAAARSRLRVRGSAGAGSRGSSAWRDSPAGRGRACGHRRRRRFRRRCRAAAAMRGGGLASVGVGRRLHACAIGGSRADPSLPSARCGPARVGRRGMPAIRLVAVAWLPDAAASGSKRQGGDAGSTMGAGVDAGVDGGAGIGVELADRRGDALRRQATAAATSVSITSAGAEAYGSRAAERTSAPCPIACDGQPVRTGRSCADQVADRPRAALAQREDLAPRSSRRRGQLVRPPPAARGARASISSHSSAPTSRRRRPRVAAGRARDVERNVGQRVQRVRARLRRRRNAMPRLVRVGADGRRHAAAVEAAARGAPRRRRRHRATAARSRLDGAAEPVAVDVQRHRARRPAPPRPQEVVRPRASNSSRSRAALAIDVRARCGRRSSRRAGAAARALTLAQRQVGEARRRELRPRATRRTASARSIGMARAHRCSHSASSVRSARAARHRRYAGSVKLGSVGSATS